LGSKLGHGIDNSISSLCQEGHSDPLLQKQINDANVVWMRFRHNSLNREQFVFVGQSDSVLKPMMNLGSRKPPLSADAPTWESVSRGQLGDLLW
jgi:hypothetical protein